MIVHLVIFETDAPSILKSTSETTFKNAHTEMSPPAGGDSYCGLEENGAAEHDAGYEVATTDRKIGALAPRRKGRTPRAGQRQNWTRSGRKVCQKTGAL
jgi:hypothetical protein